MLRGGNHHTESFLMPVLSPFITILYASDSGPNANWCSVSFPYFPALKRNIKPFLLRFAMETSAGNDEAAAEWDLWDLLSSTMDQTWWPASGECLPPHISCLQLMACDGPGWRKDKWMSVDVIYFPLPCSTRATQRCWKGDSGSVFTAVTHVFCLHQTSPANTFKSTLILDCLFKTW